MSESVDRFLSLATQFGDRVEAAPDDAWSRPSPCEEWAARDVVAHVVDSMRSMVTTLGGEGGSPMSADEDPKEAWRGTFPKLRELLADESKLQTPTPTPMGEMPLELVLGRILASDVLIHTWDLARAVGGHEVLDQDAVAHAYEGLKPLDAMIRRPGVFGPKVDAPEGADLQTEFLCFLGRPA